MKTSETFKIVIENYLREKANNDVDFNLAFEKTSKSIDNCINYIITEVKKTGLCAFADNEIFNMAMKYYTDDTISIPSEIKCKVMVNQSQKDDLFSAPITSNDSTVQNNPVIKTPKPTQTSLTLFDL